MPTTSRRASPSRSIQPAARQPCSNDEPRPCTRTTGGATAPDRNERHAPEELRRLKGKAIHVHISDCDGKVHGDLPPGRGVVNFGPYLKEIKNLGIDGAVSIELEYSPEPAKIAEWVREAYTATDRLMKEANLRGN